MKKYWKSYGVFLSGTLVKILLFAAYPLAVIFMGLPAHIIGTMAMGSAMPGLLSAGSILVGAELILDIFVFGGILNKETNKLEYLKTSHRGIPVLRKALQADKVRRVLMIHLILAVFYLLGAENMSYLSLISFTFATAAVTELILVLSRHITQMNWLMLVIMLASLVEMGIGVLALILPPVCVILFVVLYVGIFLFSEKIVMKRMEESYYDSRA